MNLNWLFILQWEASPASMLFIASIWLTLMGRDLFSIWRYWDSCCVTFLILMPDALSAALPSYFFDGLWKGEPLCEPLLIPVWVGGDVLPAGVRTLVVYINGPCRDNIKHYDTVIHMRFQSDQVEEARAPGWMENIKRTGSVSVTKAL